MSLADVVRPFVDSPSAAGIFIDFDGTLAPIVEEPSAAKPLAGADRLLARLAARYARVAVVSGRPAAFLAEHLAGAGATALVGLYGLERFRGNPDRIEVSAEAQSWTEAVSDAAAAAEREAPAGVGVERKGLTVTLHYRGVPQHAGWVRAFASSQAGELGLVAHPAKMSVELRPPTATDKGTVVSEMAVGLDAVCFVGDDAGDLPAFAALSSLAARGVHTLAVAVAGEETPPALLQAADLTVEGVRGAHDFLERLAGAAGR